MLNSQEYALQYWSLIVWCLIIALESKSEEFFPGNQIQTHTSLSIQSTKQFFVEQKYNCNHAERIPSTVLLLYNIAFYASASDWKTIDKSFTSFSLYCAGHACTHLHIRTWLIVMSAEEMKGKDFESSRDCRWRNRRTRNWNGNRSTRFHFCFHFFIVCMLFPCLTFSKHVLTLMNSGCWRSHLLMRFFFTIFVIFFLFAVQSEAFFLSISIWRCREVSGLLWKHYVSSSDRASKIRCSTVTKCQVFQIDSSFLHRPTDAYSTYFGRKDDNSTVT